MRISYAFARGLLCCALLVVVTRCNTILGNEPGDLGSIGVGGADAGVDGPDGGADGSDCGSLDDPQNCGVCGHDCTRLANVSPGATGIECRKGACVVPPGACAAGFGHCSSRPDDGCEADFTDATNCGGCGVSCPATMPFCMKMSAGSQCTASCQSPTPNACAGSCVNLDADPKNCGACGNECASLPNVRAGAAGIECRSGVCFVPSNACAPGFAHCSGQPEDGCETDITRPEHCGQCGRSCAPPTPLCSTNGGVSTCSSSCAAPAPDACGRLCVDLQSDPTNCGACGFDCTRLPNVRPGAAGVECHSGACFVPPSACVSGYAHCSNQPADGCEANLTDGRTCGSCTNACPATAPLCQTSTTPFACVPDCRAPTPKLCAGRCIDTQTDPKNCGACGFDCAALPHVKPGATNPSVQCAGGACVVQPSACVAGFGHCTSTPNVGCETPTTTPANCGDCGVSCTACFTVTAGGQMRGQCPAVWDAPASVWDGPLVLWDN